nr:hypothetical protein [Mucilaginibacter sp. X5P1]MBB6141693.1 putative Zn ribbon protein [Mucilaginibacter sp. X5P1]
MKRTLVLLLPFTFYLSACFSQEYVFDPQVFASVTANAAVRSSAEAAHNNYLVKIKQDIQNINTNMGSVVLAQDIIYYGLSGVNSALKDGLEVKNMTFITADIISYLNQSLELAKGQPYLLLFATNIDNEMRLKAISLVSDVSGYILKEGDNVLADYGARDELLRKVTLKLQVLDGLAYGAWRAMFWAKENGIITSVNPYANFINKDKSFVTQIIANAKYLKQ